MSVGFTSTDVEIGGNGRDLFSSDVGLVDGKFGGTRATVTNFRSGEDRIEVGFIEIDGGGSGWFNATYLFDTDSDGYINAADEFAAIRSVSFGGVTRSSLVLDIGAAHYAHRGGDYTPGAAITTLFGVTELSASAGDFWGG